ncbi:MAG: choice-of-anchor L domain-containing protein [Bacteroidota bacterium]
MKPKFYLLVLLTLFTVHQGVAQLNINKNISVNNLVQNVLIGSGVTVSNVSYSGSSDAIGKFSNGGATSMGLNSGLILSTGDVNDAPGPNNSGSISTNNGTGSDPDLANLIPGYTVNDAAVIEFDFVPIGDTLEFQYVFGSDEYPEFVNSNFNDVFGFFVTGPNPNGGQYQQENIALIPGTTMPVTIDNVNDNVNSQYYVDNTSGTTIEYDGHTVILTAWVVVEPCQNYSFKIAIGDAGDSSYDSAVFLEEGSFSTDAVEIDTDFSVPGIDDVAIEGCNEVIIEAKLNKIKPNDYVVNIDSMWGTATNGVDFPLVADSIVIPASHYTGEIVISPIADTIPEGTEYFYMIIETSVCNTDTIEIPIMDYTPIDLTTSPDTAICEDSVMLNVDAQFGNPPYSYSWSPNSSLNDPNTDDPVGTPTQSTTYEISVTDTTGCPAIVDTVEVTVNPKPSPSLAMPDPREGCEPLDVYFQDYSSGNITGWLWDFGDGNSSSSKSPTHTYNAGTYDIQLTVTSDAGCADSIKIPNAVEVYQQPTAGFTANPDITSVDDPTINFTDNSSNGMYWLYNFGNGDTSNAQEPTYTYDQEGKYNVMQIVYTDEGCADTAYNEVQIIVDNITIPNIITPNGDGKNDVFEIENIEKLKGSNLIIYNRWGKKVYEQSNYKNDWDGDNLADGVYYYVLEYETFLEKRTASGSVTILRK